MAELAATLIGIASAGAKVAMVLSTIASSIGSAGWEAQVTAREIRSFCSVIRYLSQTVEIVKNTKEYSHCSQLVSDMTAVSQEMFTEILNLVDGMRAPGGIAGYSIQPGSKLNFAGRIKWVMSKPKLAFLRTAIEAYKADLNLLLGSIQFAQSLDTHLDPESDERGIESNIRDPEGHSAPQASRSSHVIPQTLEDLALEYQASLQELEATRQALNDDNLTDSILEPVTSTEGLVTNEEVATFPVIPGLGDMIQNLRSEVGSLRSASSSVYAESTSSVYSSLSMYSIRLSMTLDEFSLGQEPAFDNVKRVSQAMRASAPGILSPIFEISSPNLLPRNSPDLEGEIQGWTGGVPPWGKRLLAEKLILNLSSAYATLDCTRDVGTLLEAKRDCDSFFGWAQRLVQFLENTPHSSRKIHLEQLLSLMRPPSPSNPGHLAYSFSSPSSAYQVSPSNPTRETSTMKDSSVEIVKSLRVSMDDPCWKVLPAALKKYHINAAGDYNLCLAHGDKERVLGAEEKPLVLFKQLDREGKGPMFLLKKKVV